MSARYKLPSCQGKLPTSQGIELQALTANKLVSQFLYSRVRDMTVASTHVQTLFLIQTGLLVGRSYLITGYQRCYYRNYKVSSLHKTSWSIDTPCCSFTYYEPAQHYVILFKVRLSEPHSSPPPPLKEPVIVTLRIIWVSIIARARRFLISCDLT